MCSRLDSKRGARCGCVRRGTRGGSEGARRSSFTCFETFPHAVVCALAGRVVAARPKRETRRNALRQRGYDVGSLTNVDFVDAGLCAITADAFVRGRVTLFGKQVEGFIVVPVG